MDALIAQYQTEHCQIVASRYCEILSAPMLIDCTHWPELFILNGNTGAHKILSLHKPGTTFIDWSDGQFDLNTPKDTENFRREYSRVGSPVL